MSGYTDPSGSPREPLESLFIALHYGYTGELMGYAFEGDVWADWDDYEDYKRECRQTIRETNPDLIVGVVTERIEDASREFLEPLLDDYSHVWIYTEERSPKLTEEGNRELAEILFSLEDGAEVILSGESDNEGAPEDKCIDHYLSALEEVESQGDVSFTVEKGPTFPTVTRSYDEWKNSRGA